MTQTLEKNILDVASQLDGIANELTSIFKTHGYTVGEIEKASMSERVNELERKGTQLYDQVVPLAHELYKSWPKAKQIRGSRYLRVEMAKGGAFSHNMQAVFNYLEDLERGRAKHMFNLPMNADEIRTAVYLLRGVVNENRNPDVTDPYWDRIRGSVVIEPRPGYAIKTLFHQENGNGLFDDYEWERVLKSNSEIPKVIDELVEKKKVIFFPIKTHLESVNFRHAWDLQLPFEFEVREPEEKVDRIMIEFTGKLVGKIVAEEFSPFTSEDSKRVKQFLQKHILKE